MKIYADIHPIHQCKCEQTRIGDPQSDTMMYTHYRSMFNVACLRVFCLHQFRKMCEKFKRRKQLQALYCHLHYIICSLYLIFIIYIFVANLFCSVFGVLCAVFCINFETTLGGPFLLIHSR